MNKTELVKKIAEEAEISQATVGRVLDAMEKVIREALRSGEQVTVLDSFVQIKTSILSARTGRNPRVAIGTKPGLGKPAAKRAAKPAKPAAKPAAKKPVAKIFRGPTGGGGPGKGK